MTETGVAGLLRVMLGAGSPMLPFAVAVATQLSGARTGSTSVADAVALVGLVLEPLVDGGERPGSEILLRNPELLASFFQNADLLDPADAATPRLAALVMEALELVGTDLP